MAGKLINGVKIALKVNLAPSLGHHKLDLST